MILQNLDVKELAMATLIFLHGFIGLRSAHIDIMNINIHDCYKYN